MFLGEPSEDKSPLLLFGLGFYSCFCLIAYGYYLVYFTLQFE